MARADDDTWDLASSVGATATMVAAARAAASRRPHPVVTTSSPSHWSARSDWTCSPGSPQVNSTPSTSTATWGSRG